MTENENKKPNIAITGGGRNSGGILKVHISLLEELEAYRAIGTIEDFKALKEKSVAKKPIDRATCKDGIIALGDVGICPNCGHIVAEDMLVCEDCFQVLDWSE